MRADVRVRASNDLLRTQVGYLGGTEAKLRQHLEGVLPPLGRSRRQTGWRASEGDRLPHHLQDAARVARLDLLHDAQVGDLWVGEHLLDGVDGPRGYASGIETLDPVSARAMGEMGLDGPVKGIAVFKARSSGGELRIGEKGGRIESLAKALPHLPTGRGNVDIAVARLEHPGRDAGWMVVASLSGNLARIEPARGLEIEHEDLRLQQRGGNLLALAGLLPLQQRHEDAEGAEQAGGKVGNGNADPHRSSPWLTGDGHEATETLRDLIEARTVAIGAVLAEPGNAGVDEAGIDLAEGRVIDPEAGLHIGAEVLDHHVGFGSEATKGCSSRRRFEVERNAALVAMQVLEIRTVAGAAQTFPRVQVLGELDLDDIGTPVGKLTHGGRTGAHAGQIENGEALKRARSIGNGHGLTSSDSMLRQPWSDCKGLSPRQWWVAPCSASWLGITGPVALRARRRRHPK